MNEVEQCFEICQRALFCCALHFKPIICSLEISPGILKMKPKLAEYFYSKNYFFYGKGLRIMPGREVRLNIRDKIRGMRVLPGSGIRYRAHLKKPSNIL